MSVTSRTSVTHQDHENQATATIGPSPATASDSFASVLAPVVVLVVVTSPVDSFSTLSEPTCRFFMASSTGFTSVSSTASSYSASDSSSSSSDSPSSSSSSSSSSSKSSYVGQPISPSQARPRWKIHQTYRIINNADNQTAARACGDVLIISQLRFGYLKSVAARAGIMVDPLFGIPDHVFNLNFIVVATHDYIKSKGRGIRRWGR